MHVIMVLASMSRHAAGVGVSVRGLCEQLRRDCCVSVLAVEDEFSQRDKGAWLPLEPRVFDPCGPRQFGYAPELGRTLRTVSCDLIHSHGLWMYPDIAVRRAAQWLHVPLVVSPHGMLDGWALRHAAWKKKLAGQLFTNRALHHAACLHALCESEYRSIREYGLTSPVCVIPNGVDLPDDAAPRPADDAGKTLLFLGRIHPKKGLENLLRAWAAARGLGDSHDGWRLMIAGDGPSGHERRLRDMARDLAVERNVVFRGPLQGHGKQAALAQADAFVLPSHSEGLPMAVLEAWAHRVPVVMTRECHLPEGFAVGAALEVRPEPESIAAGLQRLFSMDRRQLRAAGEKGRALVERRFTWPTVASAMADVYRWLRSGGPQPDCVRTE